MAFSFRDYLLGFQSLQKQPGSIHVLRLSMYHCFCRSKPDHQRSETSWDERTRDGSFIGSQDGTRRELSRTVLCLVTDVCWGRRTRSGRVSSYLVRELVDWELKLAVMRTGLALLWTGSCECPGSGTLKGFSWSGICKLERKEEQSRVLWD